MPHAFHRYVAIGDSFTEGMGDELPDGRIRGWADLVALALARSSSQPVSYANLAIRGRLLEPIVTSQLEAAIALEPELLSLNGGGNDILRPRVSVAKVAERIIEATERARRAGIHVLLASGANPSRHLPLGRVFDRRGDQLADAVLAHLPREGVTFVDNWHDAELTKLEYWSVDKLHLNAAGHARVAGNMLAGLGIAAPAFEHAPGVGERPGTAAYWRHYVLPWIGRRLTGRSSGDTREPKRAGLEPMTP